RRSSSLMVNRESSVVTFRRSRPTFSLRPPAGIGGTTEPAPAKPHRRCKVRPEPQVTRFSDALHEQIANEFAASQQYVAIAVHYDAQALPQLTQHFYRQALE